MPKICSSATCKPLEVCVSLVWRLMNSKLNEKILLTRKSGPQIFQNYHLLSLLPACGKALAKLMFNEMFKFFMKKKILLHRTNLDLSLKSHVSIKSTNFLIAVMRLEVFYLDDVLFKLENSVFGNLHESLQDH